jgi:hypothetical protein
MRRLGEPAKKEKQLCVIRQDYCAGMMAGMLLNVTGLPTGSVDRWQQQKSHAEVTGVTSGVSSDIIDKDNRTLKGCM